MSLRSAEHSADECGRSPGRQLQRVGARGLVTLGYDKFIDAEHHRLAREALERAVELDPGFALARG